MTKSAWEARVGVLLDTRFHPEFVYSYKPYDSAAYGGQPRIDWHAADQQGCYWLIEVKALPENRRSINLEQEVTPGQKAGLTSVAATPFGKALLAVGQGTQLYLFDWYLVQHLLGGIASPLLLLSQASVVLSWKGTKAWQAENLYETWRALDLRKRPLMTPAGMMAATVAGRASVSAFVPPSLLQPIVDPGPGTSPIPSISGTDLSPTLVPGSPSTSKPRDSIRTRRRRLLSALSSSKQPD